QAPRRWRGDPLDRISAVGREARAQDLVATLELVEAPLHRRDVQVALEPEHGGGDVGAAGGLQLGQPPQPLLTFGQRKPSRPGRRRPVTAHGRRSRLAQERQDLGLPRPELGLELGRDDVGGSAAPEGFPVGPHPDVDPGELVQELAERGHISNSRRFLALATVSVYPNEPASRHVSSRRKSVSYSCFQRSATSGTIPACWSNFMSPIIRETGCTPSVMRDGLRSCGCNIAGSNSSPRNAHTRSIAPFGSATRSSKRSRCRRPSGTPSRKRTMFSWRISQTISASSRLR